jgi:hypothetical protein
MINSSEHLSFQPDTESDISSESLSVEKMQQAIERNGSTRFHDHLEGIFTATDLSTRGIENAAPGLFERIGLNLPQSIIDSMHDTMAPAESKKDLTQFIGRLSTRWLRAGLMWGILHSKETGITGEQILEEYFKAALDKLYSEGAVNVEMMMAVFNMTLEGDLSFVPTPHERMNPTQEEKDLIKQWNEQVSIWNEQGIASQRAPTICSYLKAFKRVVTLDDRLTWEDVPKPELFPEQTNERLPHGQRMKVTSIIQIRRDQPTDRILMDDISNVYPMPGKHGQDVLRNLVNYYYGVDDEGPLFGGFNIAGIEDLPDTELYRFTGFRKVLAYNNIPLNVHAGEIRMNEWINSIKDSLNFDEYNAGRDYWIPPAVRQGVNNLYVAIMENNIGRLGHANLLTAFPVLEQRCIELGKIIEACRTSNIWTSVATEQVHAIIDEAKQILDLRNLVLPQVDDEAIFDMPHAYAQEAYYFAQETGLLTGDNYDEVAIYLRDKGEEALVWKKRPQKRPKKVLPYDEVPGTVVPLDELKGQN